MRYRLKGTENFTPDIPALGYVIQEIKRELAMRAVFFERRIADGKMSRDQAMDRYKRLDGARAVLEWLYNLLDLSQPPFAPPLEPCPHSLTQMAHYLNLRSGDFCDQLKARYPDPGTERRRMCRLCFPVFDLICYDQINQQDGYIPNGYFEEHYKKIKKAILQLTKEIAKERRNAAAAEQRGLL